MENASKALVIAGAILISILLISVGLVVFNSTKGVVDQGTQASKLMEAEIYNSNFTKYCGDNVPGSNVINLRNFVRSYNSGNKKKVTLTGPDTISPTSNYSVSPEYTDGYITKITVTLIPKT